MRTFLVKLGLLSAVVAAFFWSWASWPGWRHDFGNGETDSNLYVIQEDRAYDLLLLGTSHGRIFSRSGNHTRVERILDASMINLSRGGGRGVYATRLYVDWFFRKGNHAGTMVYFVDPWVFYSPRWNEENDLFSDEPLDLGFFAFVARRGVSLGTLVNYVKSKADINWLLQAPVVGGSEDRTLAAADPEAIRKRTDSLYFGPLEEATFQKYARDLEAIVATARERNMRVILIIPSALLGDLAGEERLKEEMRRLQAKYGIEWHDHSDAISDPALYYNVDHLNTEGIQQYTERFLKPIISEQEAS